MGNQTINANCCEVVTTTFYQVDIYNQIDPALTQNVDYLKTPEIHIPRYKNSSHTGLVNYLHLNQIKFTDKYFPFQSALGFQNLQKPKWKRIPEVYPHYVLSHKNDYTFNYLPNEHSLAKDNFVKLTQQLMKYPSLLDQIFPIKQVRKQGFYALYFALDGNIKERTEIVIDDYIPLDRKLEYLYGKPDKPFVWMILIEKALAKIVKSYYSMKNLTAEQMFEEITGVPLLNPHRIIFHENYHISSQKIEFPCEESRFFKFTIDQTVKITFFIWQHLQQLTGDHQVEYTPMIMQLINTQKKKRIYYQKQNTKNKIIMSNKNSFLTLEKGMYMIHVFNRSQTNKNLNLVVYGSERVDLHLTKGASFEKILESAIFNTYRQIHDIIKPLHQFKDVSTRFSWDGHRGLLCLKNESEEDKRIQIRIESMYEREILFERFKDKKAITETCEGGKHLYVYFIRRRDREMGRFYHLSISR